MGVRGARGRTTRIGAALAAVLAVAMTTTLSAALAVGAPGVEAATMTPELRDRIQGELDRFREQHGIPGMSAAVVTPHPDDTAHPDGTAPVITTFVSGHLDGTRTALVDAETTFELGSETKTFTADLLAALVAEGRVHLDDPVEDHVPAGVSIPHWTDPDTGHITRITLRDLSTHQSGLTDFPPNFQDGCDDVSTCPNPRPGYTRDMLWAGLDGHELLWKPGTKWLYSNWAFGLLGTVLADLVATTPPTDPPSYQAALDEQFLAALPMPATGLEPPIPAANFARPTLPDGSPAFLWDNTNALAGGGGLVSNAHDMGHFVAAHLGYGDASAPLGVRSMATTLDHQRTITEQCSSPTECASTDFGMGLAWQLYAGEPLTGHGIRAPYAFKNGGTDGSSSDTALAPSLRVGVSTMFNQQRAAGGDEIATVILAMLVVDAKGLPATGAGVSPVGMLGFAALLLAAGAVMRVSTSHFSPTRRRVAS